MAGMTSTDRTQAKAEFIRIMKWILLAAVLMVVAALIYLHASGAYATTLRNPCNR